MSQNPGWLHRVFGAREGEDALAGARAELAARDARIAELERQLQGSPEAAGTTERERELSERLSLAIADRTTLGAELAELHKRLAAHESALTAEAERSTTLAKAATAANRRAEQRTLELQEVEKRRAEAEASAAAARSSLEQVEQGAAARERELSAKSDALAAAEWKIETLERELEQAGADLTRARGEHASARAAESRLCAELASVRERDAALRTALRGVIELSAHALHRTLGQAVHLGVELGAERSRGLLATLAAPDGVRQLNEHLALLGVADELNVRREGERFEGGFRLWPSSDDADVLPLARWVAAYAVELFGAGMDEPLRLETLTGGPSEFRFRAALRAPPPAPPPVSHDGAPQSREALREAESSTSG